MDDLKWVNNKKLQGWPQLFTKKVLFQTELQYIRTVYINLVGAMCLILIFYVLFKTINKIFILLGIPIYVFCCHAI